MTSSFSSNQQAPRPRHHVLRTDGETIDWANVAVETVVMMRLQGAPAASKASQGDPPAKG